MVRALVLLCTLAGTAAAQVPLQAYKLDLNPEGSCPGGTFWGVTAEQLGQRGRYGAAWRGQASTEFGQSQGLIPGLTAVLPLACNLHDICYQTCRSSKQLCDIDFKARMRRTCDAAYPPDCPVGMSSEDCYGRDGYVAQRGRCSLDFDSYANLYHQGVNVFGSSTFEQRQTQYCNCCNQEHP